MSERRPATTIGELDIHLWNVMQAIEEVQKTLGTLATKSYVDDQVRQINERIQESKPSTQLKNIAAVLSAILVVVAFMGVVYEVMSVVRDIKAVLPVKAP